MISKALTWDELADIYDKEHKDCPARTLPMDDIYTWAEEQEDRFYIDLDKGTLHTIIMSDGR